jgi:hypothetical protein
VCPTAMVCVLVLPHHVAKAAACGCQHVPQVCCQAAQAGRSCAPCSWACRWCVWFDGYKALWSQCQASMCVCSVRGFKGNKGGGGTCFQPTIHMPVWGAGAGSAVTCRCGMGEYIGSPCAHQTVRVAEEALRGWHTLSPLGVESVWYGQCSHSTAYIMLLWLWLSSTIVPWGSGDAWKRRHDTAGLCTATVA